MTFNPDLSKQTQQVIFSTKTVKISHPSITFNTVPVARTCQKHLGLYLDENLSFYDHIISKANKGIGIIKKLLNTLPRNSLLTIYKSFIRLHLDYCDIIYDQPNNESFCTKIEHIQHNAAFAISGAIKATFTLSCIKFIKFQKMVQASALSLELKHVVNQNISST